MIIPDLSFWQDDPTTPQGVDFGVMAQRTQGVIIRAGQNTWTDKKFTEHWANAKAAGLKRAAYWFYDSRVSPKKQAELFAELLRNQPPEMEAWADFEDTYGGAFGRWQDWYDFIDYFRAAAPNIRVGIYTGYYYWRERVQAVAALKYFSQYPLWIAWYNKTPPLIPPPFTGWRYWQFTDNGDGELYGVESKNIDLNYFNGDENLFASLYGGLEKLTNQMTASFGQDKVIYQEQK